MSGLLKIWSKDIENDKKKSDFSRRDFSGEGSFRGADCLSRLVSGTDCVFELFVG